MSLGTTFDNKITSGTDPVDTRKKVFVGTRMDSWAATVVFRKEFWTEKSGPGDVRLLVWVIGIVDLPFSIAMDTILLPYTIPHDSRLKDKEPE